MLPLWVQYEDTDLFFTPGKPNVLELRLKIPLAVHLESGFSTPLS